MAAGVTLFEALDAARRAREGGHRRPRHRPLLGEAARRGDAGRRAAAETRGIVTVEDHSVCGGIGEAVAAAVAGGCPVEILGVREIPRSGKPDELMAAHGLTKDAIIKAVRKAR